MFIIFGTFCETTCVWALIMTELLNIDQFKWFIGLVYLKSKYCEYYIILSMSLDFYFVNGKILNQIYLLYKLRMIWNKKLCAALNLCLCLVSKNSLEFASNTGSEANGSGLSTRRLVLMSVIHYTNNVRRRRFTISSLLFQSRCYLLKYLN